MLSTIRSLLKDESGATAIEYALLLAGVAVVILGSMTGIGTSIGTIFTRVKEGLTTAAAG